MQSELNKHLGKLQKIIFIYSIESEVEKTKLLETILRNKEWKFSQLNHYHELLLFMAAHPQSNSQLKLVEKGLFQIGKFMNTQKSKTDEAYTDSGLPYTRMNTRFSHDLLQWANSETSCKLSIDYFEEGATDLNALLNLTLPSVERTETTAGLSNQDLLQTLGVKQNARLSFLLNEFSKLNGKPLVKDYLWESMKLWINIHSVKPSFSRTLNKLPVKRIFFQQELLKKFDHESLINSSLPKCMNLSVSEKKNIADVVKISLLLTMRETDPSTYMDESSLRFYNLERGISIAIYGMKANRQLPLQSYIGYTLFKNGYPAAYGGSWIFGRSAQFGLNIFETFRGGESGYMMCQLLRVYKQVFQLDTIEVDAYQFGRDNMDGIHSGAFWFYYRFGFRPMNRGLQTLAKKEAEKIKSIPSYRTSAETLVQFTESNMMLKLENTKPLQYADIYTKISKMIQTTYHSDRLAAEHHCVNYLLQRDRHHTQYNSEEMEVLKEVALMCRAMGWSKKKEIEILFQMIQVKPVNPYEYNSLLTELLNSESALEISS